MRESNSSVGNGKRAKREPARLRGVMAAGDHEGCLILARAGRVYHVAPPLDDHDFSEPLSELALWDLQALAARSVISRDAALAYGIAGKSPCPRADVYAQALAKMRSAREVDMIELMGTIRRRLLVRRVMRSAPLGGRHG